MRTIQADSWRGNFSVLVFVLVPIYMHHYCLSIFVTQRPFANTVISYKIRQPAFLET